MATHKQRLDIATKLERDFIRKMETEYGISYKEIKRIIRSFIDQYGINGVLSNQAYLYNRFGNLVDSVIAKAGNLNFRPPMTSYLGDQYLFNYYYTGFLLESEYQQKLAYKTVYKKNLDPLSTYSKLVLDENKKVLVSDLRRSLTQSVAQGEGIQASAKRIQRVIETDMNRSLRIARTETTTIMNKATYDSMIHASSFMPLKKEWIATADDRTRESHVHMDGEVVSFDKHFSNGLLFPGDQNGEASEVVNCRCTMSEVIEGYEDASAYRRARGTDGQNKLIPYTTVEAWKKNRLF